MGCRTNCSTASKAFPRVLNRESLLIDRMIASFFDLFLLSLEDKQRKVTLYMERPIPFPKNYESYVTMSMEAFQVGDFHQSVTYLKKALAIEMDDELLQLCLTIMQEIEQYTDGVQLLIKYKPELWQSMDSGNLDLLLITFLIYADRLNEAKEQISIRKQKLIGKDEGSELYSILEQNLLLVEEKRTQERNKKIAVLREQNKNILNKGYHQQANFLKKYTILPKNKFLETSQSFLDSDKVHAFLKTEILEILIKEKWNEAITVTKGSYQGTYQTEKLYPVHLSPLLKESKPFFDKLYSHTPDLQQQMESNLFLHCAYFYPFEREALQSVEEWQEAMDYLSFPMDSSSNQADQEVLQNIKRAEKDLNPITEM